MSKKGFNKSENDCPICGGKIWGRGQKVMMEGARITVCQSCAQYGTKIQNKPKSSFSSIKPSYQRSNISRPKNLQIKKKIRANSLDDMEIVSDYAKKVRNARMVKKLNQDQFAQKLNEKPSLIRRIESGKVKPTIKLAQKIQKVYNIALLKKTDEIEVNTKRYMKKTQATSLGDIAFIKKKK